MDITLSLHAIIVSPNAPNLKPDAIVSTTDLDLSNRPASQ